MKKLLALLVLLLMSNNLLAKTFGICEVKVFKNGSWLDRIKTPQLKAYSSFKIPTCRFPSQADPKLKLMTSLLSGPLFAAVTYDGEIILKVSGSGNHMQPHIVSGWAKLPTGNEVSIRCDFLVDTLDMHDIIDEDFCK